MIIRPEPRFPAPEGHHWITATDPDWQVGGEDRQCRFYSPRDGRCPNGAVAKMRRQRGGRNSWWHYCGDHMYGRWVEGGAVLCWRVDY